MGEILNSYPLDAQKSGSDSAHSAGNLAVSTLTLKYSVPLTVQSPCSSVLLEHLAGYSTVSDLIVLLLGLRRRILRGQVVPIDAWWQCFEIGDLQYSRSSKQMILEMGQS